VTRLLLDTHAVLWWLAGDEMLSVGAWEAISEEHDSVFVSAASIWEISAKHRLGKLPRASAIAGDLAAARAVRRRPFSLELRVTNLWTNIRLIKSLRRIPKPFRLRGREPFRRSAGRRCRFLFVALWVARRAAFALRLDELRQVGGKPMQGARLSLEDLRHDLDETKGVIDILERASQELATIIDWDEAVRRNPLRQRQLHSIGEQLALARGKRTSLARMIEKIEGRP
jgi:PIN domain nuclease of toxin-antitoxin system